MMKRKQTTTDKTTFSYEHRANELFYIFQNGIEDIFCFSSLGISDDVCSGFLITNRGCKPGNLP